MENCGFFCLLVGWFVLENMSVLLENIELHLKFPCLSLYQAWEKTCLTGERIKGLLEASWEKSFTIKLSEIEHNVEIWMGNVPHSLRCLNAWGNCFWMA